MPGSGEGDLRTESQGDHRNHRAFRATCAHCEDAACSTFTISIVEDDFPEAGPTSIAIGSDGLPVITYHSKVAHCKEVKRSTD